MTQRKQEATTPRNHLLRMDEMFSGTPNALLSNSVSELRVLCGENSIGLFEKSVIASPLGGRGNPSEFLLDGHVASLLAMTDLGPLKT